ncbi:carbohydrate esterase family 9 protein [Mycena albidolilacea]|uniref:Carbohydrate esterase family 9 protein n=1 Tax=Mycena albidolilacea TaxID=1033008 RepID=A0AAD6ZH20_9AGAR|nr:carbohydrate esterase family 9 protein [Mycena albidolilacea]
MEKASGYPAPNLKSKKRVKPIQFALLLLAVFSYSLTYLLWSDTRTETLPINSAAIVAQCRALHLTPGPPDNFYSRTESDRFQKGTKPTLIRNATIWTGQANGNVVIQGDILIDKGLIKKVGSVDESVLRSYPDVVVLDAAGSWVSPGVVDLHSHLGVGSSPGLSGARDGNSHEGLVQPWLRSLDGLNTHDDAYRLSISGGVTVANVLPGSANTIGGQAFVIKLRPTTERSSSAMLLEPPFSLNGTYVDPFQRPRWRQMKHACGENPSRVYSGTRMDTQWSFREGYNTARKIKEKQDAYCVKALAGEWKDLGDFPEDLQWEALVDVLRGRVKVQNHCYEAVDLDGIVRLTNEFKFSVAAFHHAHEAYLVPDLIKKAYGHPPAVAIFATHGRYKREAYRGSEFAPRILADNGLDVVMKSDHPVLDSRHLIYEAQQAHYFGLAPNLALAAVTSTPARIMGQDHRIGRIIEGFDADIVVWDSHPLALGATPKQVFIDGIAQLEKPYTSHKPESAQHIPHTPDFEKEISDAIKYEGLPPLEPETAKSDVVVFRNVGSIFLKNKATRGINQVFTSALKDGVLVFEDGRIACSGSLEACPGALSYSNALYLDLEGGSISPGLVSYGSSLGLTHISGEVSTSDGPVFDPLSVKVPEIIDGTVIKAADGLLFATRDALLAYRHGVTTAVTAPTSGGFLAGLSTVFSTAAAHKLADGAVVQEVAALHVRLSLSFGISVSTQIAALRELLLDEGEGQGHLARRFSEVVAGKLPLVVNVESADIIASLLVLKKEVEAVKGKSIRLVLAGATEGHLLAKEIGEAGVGVLIQQRPYPSRWEQKRLLPGLPLTQSSAIATLVGHNVTVGILVGDTSQVRNTRFDAAWAELESNGALGRSQVLEMVSSNVETLLGVVESNSDLIATRGGFDFGGKVIAIISSRQGTVHFV